MAMVDLKIRSIDRETKLETVETETPDFPYRADIVDINALHKSTYPWHYHDDVEFFYMKEGSIEYDVPGKSVVFAEGEAGFVNTAVMHQTRAKTLHCIQEEHIFTSALLSSPATHRADSLYILPLISASGLDIVKFEKEVSERTIEIMQRAMKIFDEKAFGYELEIRSLMTSLWLLTLKVCKEKSLLEKKESADSIRIRKMALFIDEHFGESLSLSDIASAADIGERECCRCFSRMLKTSPMEYLLGVRVNKAQLLLSSSSDTVESIAEQCGFSSGSYFSKVFKARTSLSPREFRKN